MTQAQKDHTHTGDPWLVLGQLRDDLKQARAFLSKARPPNYRNNNEARALIAINRALERVGDGTREADNG